MEENQSSINSGRNLTPMIIVGVVLFLLLSIGGVFLLVSKSKNIADGDSDDLEISDSLTRATPPQLADTTNQSVEGTTGQTIELQAGSFYFSPKEIRVKQGDKVTIVMTSQDMMHDFNIDELGIKIPITKAGETNTVEFVADQKGEFEYYCSVGQHRANGQVGKLIVE